MLTFIRHLAPAVALVPIALATGGCGVVAVAGGGILDSMTGKSDPDTTPLPVQTASSAGAPGFDPAETPVAPEGGACLSVLSFNTQHKDVPVQMDVLADRLREDLGRMPDFILCQEILFDRPRIREHRDTAAVLAARIDYHSRGVARAGGTEGVAILSRYPFEHFDHLHLDARSSFFSFGFPRVSVMGEFRVPDLGLVRVVNVHLSYRKSKHNVRGDQLRETLDWLASREREVPADVTVLGGDFNMEPNWTELAYVLRPGLVAGLEFRDYNSALPTLGQPGRPFRRVDYVYIAAPEREITHLGESLMWPNGMIASDGMTQFHISDHVPLLHVFAVGGPGAADAD
ncbi:MAG: endonuclease/exonuclease/phosphatase family protein [Planctomycetota bacterium]